MDFAEIVKEYKTKIFNLAFRFVNDYDEAQDLTQETFLAAYKSFEKFKGESEIFTWLYRIALNRCKKAYHKKKWQKIFSLEREAIKKEVENLAESKNNWQEKETQAIVQEKVTKLPPKYREVIILKYFQELSCEEIAVLLKSSVGTIKSRLARGRDLLEKNLSTMISRSDIPV
ncbi:MAG: RNA polymerase sigma factor [Candidatus Edwardsbacteria bacterium]